MDRQCHPQGGDGGGPRRSSHGHGRVKRKSTSKALVSPLDNPVAALLERQKSGHVLGPLELLVLEVGVSAQKHALCGARARPWVGAGDALVRVVAEGLGEEGPSEEEPGEKGLGEEGPCLPGSPQRHKIIFIYSQLTLSP